MSSCSIQCPLFDVQVPRIAMLGKFLSGEEAADTASLDIVEQRLREELYLVSGVISPDSSGVTGIRAIQYDTAAKKVRGQIK